MSTTTKRDAILEAALRLFADRGFHGTTVPDLAAAAGVGAGTIYRYFPSKDAVVNALFQHWKSTLGAEVLAGLPLEGSWRSRFRALFFGLIGFHHANPGAIAFLDLNRHGDYLDAESRAIEATYAELLLQLVSAGQADEVFVDLPPAAVIGMVYGAFLGLIRGEAEGWFALDEALVAATEERAWILVRR